MIKTLIKVIKIFVAWLGIALICIAFILLFLPWTWLEGKFILPIGIFIAGLVLIFGAIMWERYEERKWVKKKIGKKELKP